MPIKKTTAKKVIKKSIKKGEKTTLKIDVYDIDGKVSGKINLSEDIFAAKVNPALMAQAVRVYSSNQRQGTASTKTRSMVTGSTRKIYRQKGTGRARHGDIKAPIFIGGGIAHGPHPRDFSLDMPKNMKRKALFSALTAKLKDGELIAVSGLEKVKEKTKEMMHILQNLNLKDKKDKKVKKILMVLPNKLNNLILSARNIEGMTITYANLLNTYDVVRNHRIIFLKDSFEALEKTYLTKDKKE